MPDAPSRQSLLGVPPLATPQPPAPPAPPPAPKPISWGRSLLGLPDEGQVPWLDRIINPPPLDPNSPFADLERRHAEYTAQREREGADARKKIMEFTAPARQLAGQAYGAAKNWIGQQFTPDPQMQEVGRVLHEGVAQRFTPPATASPVERTLLYDYNPYRLMADFGINAATDATTPGGAASNLLDVGPVVKGVVGAAKLGAGLVKGSAGMAAMLGKGRGLYSRVDDIVRQIPASGVHPSKLLSLLKSGANAEEVAFRNIPALVAEAGNTPITREQFAAHLAANPAPMPKVTVLGESTGWSPQLEEAWNNREFGQLGARPSTAHEWMEASERLERVAQQHQRVGDHTQANHYFNLSEEAHSMAEELDLGSPPSSGRTKYSSPDLNLAGGENYRETLLQLPPKTAKQGRYRVEVRKSTGEVNYRGHDISGTDVERLRQQYETPGSNYTVHFEEMETPVETFTESHHGQPGILAHVRHDERVLPPTGLRSFEEVEALIESAVGAKHGTLASGAPEVAVRKGLITSEEAALYGNAKGFTNYPHPPGKRGRFLQEVQSDWHQRGKKLGYKGQVPPESVERLKQIDVELAAARERMNALVAGSEGARNARIDEMVRQTRTFLPPEFQHLQNFDDAMRSEDTVRREAVNAWRTARDQVDVQGLVDAEKAAEAQILEHGQTVRGLEGEQTRLRLPETQGVPDAPFKENWPDLALKQQLLELAGNPEQHWLGFTSGGTQADRYDLRKYVNRLSFEPHDRGDYTLGSLVGYDKDGAEVLRHRQLEPHELDEYIGKEPAEALRREIRGREYDRGQWSVEFDKNNEEWYVTDPNGEPWEGLSFMDEEEAQQAITDYLDSPYGDKPVSEASIEGLDLEVGGKGMKYFYDQLLRKRLEKILKPFGGTVEAGTVPTTKKQMVPTTRYRLRSTGRRAGQRLPSYDFEHLEEAQRAQRHLHGQDEPWTEIDPYETMHEADAPFDEPAWMFHLTPEIRERLLKEGLPLAALPLAAGMMQNMSRTKQGDNVGSAPPVRRPIY